MGLDINLWKRNEKKKKNTFDFPDRINGNSVGLEIVGAKNNHEFEIKLDINISRRKKQADHKLCISCCRDQRDLCWHLVLCSSETLLLHSAIISHTIQLPYFLMSTDEKRRKVIVHQRALHSKFPFHTNGFTANIQNNNKKQPDKGKFDNLYIPFRLLFTSGKRKLL